MVLEKKKVSLIFVLTLLVGSIGFVSADHTWFHNNFGDLFGDGGPVVINYSEFEPSNVTIFCDDADGDGYDDCSQFTDGGDEHPTDCNDNDPDVNPGAEEVCGNGIDDNCNGEVDEGCPFCNDSDGGKDYYEAGNVTKVSGDLEVNKEDSCFSVNGEDYLQEFFCDEEDSGTYVRHRNVSCEEGCLDGRCMNSTGKSNESCEWTGLKNNDSAAGHGDYETIYEDEIDSWFKSYESNTEPIGGVCSQPEEVRCFARVPLESQLNGIDLNELQKKYSSAEINPSYEYYGSSHIGEVLDPSWYEHNNWSNYSENYSRIVNYSKTGENVTCSTEVGGVICRNDDQKDIECDFDYSVEFKCCEGLSCSENKSSDKCDEENDSCEFSFENWSQFSHDVRNTGYTNNTAPENISFEYASHSLGSETGSSPAVHNGYVYIADSEGNVHQFDALNVSNKIAEFSAGWKIDESSPAVSDKYVYIGSYDNKVYQLNASNISQKVAEFKTNGTVDSSPVLTDDYVFIGNNDARVYQLNASNISQKLSERKVKDNVEVAPALANGYLYVSNDDPMFYQLNASDISQLISNPLFSTSRSSPAVDEDHLYLADLFNLHQLNASDVSQKVAEYSSIGADDSSPAIAGNYVYAGDSTGNFHQLNSSNVSQGIAVFEGDGFDSSPAIAGNYVYVGSHDNKVYQLNASNISQKVAEFGTGRYVDSSPAIANGFLYVGSRDGNLYQLGKGGCLPEENLSQSNASTENLVSSEGEIDTDLEFSPDIREVESKSFFERLFSGRFSGNFIKEILS